MTGTFHKNERNYKAPAKRLAGQGTMFERSYAVDEEEACYLATQIAREEREAREGTDGRSAQSKRAKREAHLALKKY